MSYIPFTKDMWPNKGQEIKVDTKPASVYSKITIECLPNGSNIVCMGDSYLFSIRKIDKTGFTCQTYFLGKNLKVRVKFDDIMVWVEDTVNQDV